MTYDIDKNQYVFSSGRREYANCGIIGLSPDLVMHGGFDQCFGYNPEMFQNDKLELATHMIEQWTRFRKLVEEGKL